MTAIPTTITARPTPAVWRVFVANLRHGPATACSSPTSPESSSSAASS